MLDLALCERVYHCTPNELDEQDAERIESHLIVLNAQAGMGNMKTLKRGSNG